MKGVSTVVATLLMLMITIALAGTAYLYISGAFQQQIQSGIDIVDSFCTDGTTANITFRNIGTAALNLDTTLGPPANCIPDTGNSVTCGGVSVTRTSGGATANIDPSPSTVEPGTIGTIGDTGCTTAGTPRSCVYRITPPGGRTIIGTVPCSG